MDTVNNIKNIRKALNLTTQEFANMIGVSRYTINRWETGKSKPHPIFMKTLNKLARKTLKSEGTER